MRNPREEPPCGTPVWNPRVEPPCGTPVWNPRCGTLAHYPSRCGGTTRPREGQSDKSVTLVFVPVMLCQARRPPVRCQACLACHMYEEVLRLCSAAVQPDARPALFVQERVARSRAAAGVAGHPPQGGLHRPHRRHRHRQDHPLPYPPRAIRPDHLHRAHPQSVPLRGGTAARSAAQFWRGVEGCAEGRALVHGKQARADPHAARLPALTGAPAWQRRADH